MQVFKTAQMCEWPRQRASNRFQYREEKKMMVRKTEKEEKNNKRNTCYAVMYW